MNSDFELIRTEDPDTNTGQPKSNPAMNLFFILKELLLLSEWPENRTMRRN